jgi:hypothetical protein
VENSQPSAQLVKALRTNESGFTPIPDKCFTIPVSPADVEQCTQARNQIVSGLMIASDNLCEKHKTSIYGNEAISNISFGTLTSLFSGGAAVASAESTKTVLAALALFSNSERSLVNETVYKQMMITQIGAKVGQLRDNAKAELNQHLRSKIDEYSMVEAINGVVYYHNQCSFMNALQAAVNDGTAPNQRTKLAAMRAELSSLDAQISNLPAATKVKGQPQFDGLSARYTDLSNKIKALETAD